MSQDLHDAWASHLESQGQEDGYTRKEIRKLLLESGSAASEDSVSAFLHNMVSAGKIVPGWKWIVNIVGVRGKVACYKMVQTKKPKKA